MHSCDTLIVGSGCAAYNAAHWLGVLGRQGVLLATQGHLMGTSRNTGSDKQTYYKLSIASSEPDSVRAMAQDLYRHGGVNGYTALAEAAGSVQSFAKLANLGVPFPTNKYGEFVGYQTDHDERRRATSAGPLTSKYMTQALENEVLKQGTPIVDGLTLVKIEVNSGAVRAAVFVNENGEFVTICCNNLIVATGGEGRLYEHSVYPQSQTGALGVLAAAGLRLANLNHWQYGLASTKFRWNVSGSYQQVLPRYVSVDTAGNEREFLPDGEINNVFLKGYQWPFDYKKITASSKIDLAVQAELAAGNRVFLDFRTNPAALSGGFGVLSGECYKYLQNSGILFGTPIERLAKLNPKAIELYKSNGIDLKTEMLEIAVCAQHQNGGALVDVNWQSSISGVYVVGEAAGTFGTYRPGGTALNSAQVGSMRAAQHIARTTAQREPEIIAPALQKPALGGQIDSSDLVKKWQRLMSLYAANVRHIKKIPALLDELSADIAALGNCRSASVQQYFIDKNILTAQLVVLRAIDFACRHLQSCGGAAVVSESGEVLPTLPQNAKNILVSDGDSCYFETPAPMPSDNDWFESVWAAQNEQND